MMKVISSLVVCGLALWTRGAEDLVTKALAAKFLPGERNLSSFTAAFNAVDAADRAADARWRTLETPAAYHAWRTSLHGKMIAAVGGFPEKTPLNARVLAQIPREGYRIEKVLFESQPGVYGTGLLFLPACATAATPQPVVVIACGHSNNGKNYSGYQRAGVLVAQAGMVGFIYDPLDQGDRMQPPAPGVKPLGNCRGHNAIGVRAMLLGGSMAQLRLWDGMRAIDYVLSRPEVDGSRVGFMGQSGGGTMTSLMMAADPRIRAAAPSCYITNLRELCQHCGPQDAEQNIFGQLAFGLNHAGYVLMQDIPVCVTCKYNDFFPYYGTCATFDLVQETMGRWGRGGRYFKLAEPGPHGWIEATRNGSVQWMRRWLKGEDVMPDVEKLRLLDYGDDLSKLDCGLPEKEAPVPPTGQVADLPGFRSIYAVLREKLVRAVRARPMRSQAEVAACAVRRAGVKTAAEAGGTPVAMGEETLTNGVRLSRFAYVYPNGLALPLVILRPKVPQGRPLFVVAAGGRAACAQRVAEALAAGRAVASADLTACGEIGGNKHPFYSFGKSYPREEIAHMYYLLGESMVGHRATDLVALAQVLKGQFGEPVELCAEGDLAISAAHARACAPALFAALTLPNPPLSWTAMVNGTRDEPFENTVNGALLDYDWTDLLP